jgi:c-di-GMP-binding flagellar brake protein YcgR
VPLDSHISARIWRMADGVYIGEKPSRAQEISCDLRDLSVGGIGVRLSSRDGSELEITPTERLRILLTIDEETLLLEGKMRTPAEPQANGGILTGVTFKRLDGSIEGRQNLAILNRVIGELQRDEIKQFRASLEKPA